MVKEKAPQRRWDVFAAEHVRETTGVFALIAHELLTGPFTGR